MATNEEIDRSLIALYNTLRSETIDTIPDDDLANLINLLTDNGNDYDSITLKRVQEIRTYRRELARLRSIPLIAQRSDQWYELRKQRLTASDTAQAIGVGKFGTRKQLLQKKILEHQGKSVPFKTAPAMKWGVMFEPMAMRVYQNRNDNVSVYEFGLIPHPTLQCYGASPDGISELGIMIEIKCPFRRQITGEVPDYYELQMQGQMAVCGLKECDYIECDMQVYDDQVDYFVECCEDQHDHGVICEFMQDGEKDTWYEYSDPTLTAQQAVSWAREFSTREMRRDQNTRLVKLHMWRLRNVSIKRIYFDQKRWDEELAPKIQQFWDDVTSCNTVADTHIQSPQQSATSTLDIRDKKYKFIPDDDD